MSINTIILWFGTLVIVGVTILATRRAARRREEDIEAAVLATAGSFGPKHLWFASDIVLRQLSRGRFYIMKNRFGGQGIITATGLVSFIYAFREHRPRVLTLSFEGQPVSLRLVRADGTSEEVDRVLARLDTKETK